MLPYLYRSPAIWAFRTGTKFLSQVGDMRHSFSTCHSRGSRKLRRPDCAKPRAKRSLDGMKWSWNFCIRLFTDDQTYGMVPDRHCTVSCSKNSDLLVTSTPQTMVMWLQWSVSGTSGNQCKPVAQVRVFLDLFVDNSHYLAQSLMMIDDIFLTWTCFWPRNIASISQWPAITCNLISTDMSAVSCFTSVQLRFKACRFNSFIAELCQPKTRPELWHESQIPPALCDVSPPPEHAC